MILRNGLFVGKGKLLVDNASLGEEVEVDLKVEEDQDGVTLSGSLGGDFSGEISIRVAPDDVGTYVVDARIGAVVLDGRGKLESEPNLLLLWNEGQTQSVAITLFPVNAGIACRGFWQEQGKTRTWEILFKTRQQVVGGSNVVTLRRR